MQRQRDANMTPTQRPSPAPTPITARRSSEPRGERHSTYPVNSTGAGDTSRSKKKARRGRDGNGDEWMMVGQWRARWPMDGRQCGRDIRWMLHQWRRRWMADGSKTMRARWPMGATSMAAAMDGRWIEDNAGAMADGCYVNGGGDGWPMDRRQCGRDGNGDEWMMVGQWRARWPMDRRQWRARWPMDRRQCGRDGRW